MKTTVAVIAFSISACSSTPGVPRVAPAPDMRLDSALVAYGQLRHNHVLVFAQVYDQGGCEIPDGYVEPAPDTYKALAQYAKRGAAIYKSLDPKDVTTGRTYFGRLERLMEVLEALSREQLAGRQLSTEAKRFLAMIVERREGTASGYMETFPVAMFDGWYLDLFPDIDTALKDAAFVADYATFNRDGQQGVHYLGAKGPRLGVFVVDTGGAPRMMVGPVARGFQHTGPLATRLTDDDANEVAGDEPWAKGYTIAAPAEPNLAIKYQRGPRTEEERKKAEAWRRRHRSAIPLDTVVITSDVPRGTATIELLDHHFVKMGEVAVEIGAGSISAATPRTARPIEALRIKAGAFAGRVIIGLNGQANVTFGPAPPKDDGTTTPTLADDDD